MLCIFLEDSSILNRMIQLKMAPMPHQKVEGAEKEESGFELHAESRILIIY